MSLTHVPVVGTFTYRDADATPAAGEKIHFVAVSAAVVDGETVTLPKKIICTLNADGEVPADFTLPTVGAGVYYKVVEQFSGKRAPYTIQVLTTDTEIDLSTVAPVVPPPELLSLDESYILQGARAARDAAQVSATASEASAVAAAASAMAADSDALTAAEAAMTAGTAATSAGNSAIAASGSATAASGSATAAAGSATTASASATAAATSATAAATSATAAATANLHRPLTTLTSTAGIATIDLSQPYEVYGLALTENTSIVFTNPPAAGKVSEIRIIVTQHASSAMTCAFGASVKKFAGGTWVQSSALSAVESLGVAIRSDGSITVFPSGVYA